MFNDENANVEAVKKTHSQESEGDNSASHQGLENSGASTLLKSMQDTLSALCHLNDQSGPRTFAEEKKAQAAMKASEAALEAIKRNYEARARANVIAPQENVAAAVQDNRVALGPSQK